MSNNQEDDVQIISTIASYPFTVQITHGDEVIEVPSQMTLDRRFQFNRALPADAVWCVLQEEVAR